MQFPVFQKDRPFPDNSYQTELKNGRILPLDTGDYAPKCYPAGHQLKIKNSSKLDFSSISNLIDFPSEYSESPSQG